MYFQFQSTVIVVATCLLGDLLSLAVVRHIPKERPNDLVNLEPRSDSEVNDLIDMANFMNDEEDHAPISRFPNRMGFQSGNVTLIPPLKNAKKH